MFFAGCCCILNLLHNDNVELRKFSIKIIFLQQHRFFVITLYYKDLTQRDERSTKVVPSIRMKGNLCEFSFQTVMQR